MRQVLADGTHERRFTDEGYVVVDMLGDEDVAELVDLHATTSGVAPGFHHSLLLADTSAKAAIDAGLSASFARHLAPQLLEYVPMACTFVVKGSDGESSVCPHLDWTFVDESRHRSLNAWIALCDADASNGTLAVVPGSHRLPRTIRGSGTPSPFALPLDVVAGHLVPVPVRAGQALLYDHRLIHGSATNTSGRPRVAAALGLVPAEVVPVHYVGDRDDADAPLQEVEVDREFFHSYSLDPTIGRDPEIMRAVAGRSSRAVATVRAITSEDFHALVSPRRRGPATRLLRRLGSARRR